MRARRSISFRADFPSVRLHFRRVKRGQRPSRQDDDGACGGQRLICSSEFLGRLLKKKQAELLLLIRLQRYEKGLGNESSRFSHTTAVLRIKPTLSF
jgi:hypothetical protein